MLSRVAERLYWHGRYLERAENTARLVNVHALLMLDLPAPLHVSWGNLIDISGTAEAFNAVYQKVDERNVNRHLLTDGRNPGSILSCLAMARENARTTREILPSEAWELLNATYHAVQDHGPAGVPRKARHGFLDMVIAACQQLAGLYEGVLSRGPAYGFTQLGRHIERADMSTRILDVGSAPLLAIRGAASEDDPMENALWLNVLRSLSAFQMYRQHVRDRVNAEDVVGFVLLDEAFPRSVRFCLDCVGEQLEKLPRAEDALRSAGHARRTVGAADLSSLLGGELHGFMDEVQEAIGRVHDAIAATWWPAPAGP